MENKIDKLIKEIDEKLKELGENISEQRDEIKLSPEPDRREEGLSIIKEIVEKLSNIEDHQKYRAENEREYDNMILTLASWFNYLKRESKCYLEAKKMIMSYGEKNPKVYDWCKNLVEKEIEY